MIENPSKENRNQSSDPSDITGNSNVPQKGSIEQPKEGDKRKIEVSANSPESFDDSFGSKQEEEMARKEARTENEGRIGKS